MIDIRLGWFKDEELPLYNGISILIVEPNGYDWVELNKGMYIYQ